MVDCIAIDEPVTICTPTEGSKVEATNDCKRENYNDELSHTNSFGSRLRRVNIIYKSSSGLANPTSSRLYDLNKFLYIITKSMNKANELRARLLAFAQNQKRETLSLEGYSKAAVLVPLILESGVPHLLFTKRTEIVETHKGQISFPGGVMDPDDGDVIRTALREAWEEVGIPEAAVVISGLLDDLATPTGFIITPVVGLIEQLPRLSPNKDEVADIFQVPLSFFSDQRNGRSELREFRGRKHEVWFYQSDGHTIWGATAIIVRSLLKRLELV